MHWTSTWVFDACYCISFLPRFFRDGESDLLERNPHGGVHLRVVLRDWLDVVVPALLLPRKSSQLYLLISIGLRLESRCHHAI